MELKPKNYFQLTQYTAGQRKNMRCTQYLLALLLAIGSSNAFSLTLSEAPRAYSATYESHYQGRDVKGTRSLIKKDDHWVIRTKLKKYVVSVVEEAHVAIEDKELTPLKYEYRRSVMGVKKRQRLTYDHEAQVVHYKDGDNKGDYPLLPESFDKASQQFLIEEMLKQGVTEFSANNAARNRNKIAHYRVLGEEILELPIGVTQTIKVEIVPEKRNKRHTVMWFDPNRHYLLVQLDQTDKNGKTYSMKLSDVTFLD